MLRNVHQPKIPAPASREPVAKSIGEVLGLVKHGTPCLPALRDTPREILPFEEHRIRDLILTRLTRGYPLKTILRACGLSWEAWATWRRRGHSGSEPFATFVREVEVAQAEGAIGLLDQVRAAGEGAPDQHGIWKNDWKASRWLLERQDPDQFVEVSKSLSAHVEIPAQRIVDVTQLSDEDLETLAEIAERAPVLEAEVEET